MTIEEGGGAKARRGFEFQDIATCYFSLTDKPRYLNKQPLEFRIEQPSDFSYSISFDEYDEKHFFEVKQRGSGDIPWNYFKKEILEDFAELAEEHAVEDYTNYYHVVSNVAFSSRLNGFFENTKKLRNNNIQWPHLKQRYEERNVDQIEKYTGIDDEIELSSLISGIMGHYHTGNELLQGLKNYIQECNSPGNFRTPTREILREVNKRGSGVIRRAELEEIADISLRKKSDSTTSANNSPTLGELKDGMQGMSEDLSSAEVDVQTPRGWRNMTNDVTDKLTRDAVEDETIIENWGASMDEDLSRLTEIKKEEERLKYGLEREAQRGIELIDKSTTDNVEDKE